MAVKVIVSGVSGHHCAISRGGKDGFFKVLVFYGLKKPKTSKGRIFWFYGFFLDIVVFCINYALKPYSY